MKTTNPNKMKPLLPFFVETNLMINTSTTLPEAKEESFANMAAIIELNDALDEELFEFTENIDL